MTSAALFRRTEDLAMSEAAMFSTPADTDGATKKEHEVVALKYRPQTFEQLVGQEHVWKGLVGAIQSNRVGHAYLFTGARGTGKTTTARIFAKCLNCLSSPTPVTVPCEKCDSCISISDRGSDIDVIEIDAASTNGVDDVRDLRQNAIVRPTRARYKIYILDEAHMMSKQAFNALLKTLEEPPPHVKFIFCTTEAEKIPITILSRCQRFDFAHVETPKISQRLTQIAASEGVTVDPDAIAILARRAGGSMRDSQSLLEQLLAFGKESIRAEDVHQMLGTTDSSRLLMLLTRVAARDAAGALAEFGKTLSAGAEVGTLWDQLLGLLRDLLVLSVDGSEDLLLHSLPGEAENLRQLAKQFGIETILALVQIVDQTMARLRFVQQPRILVEIALVRMCRIADLLIVSQVVQALRTGNLGTLTLNVPAVGMALPAPVPKDMAAPAPSVAEPTIPTPALKKNEVADQASDPAIENEVYVNGHESLAAIPVERVQEQSSTSIPDETESEAAPLLPAANDTQLIAAWRTMLAERGDILSDNAGEGTPSIVGGQLVLTFAKRYNFRKQSCERAGNLQQLEQWLEDRIGRRVKIVTTLSDEHESTRPAATVAAAPTVGSRQRQQEIAHHPLVKKAIETFAARVVGVMDADPNPKP
jgi:DNA polymerase-3 subunit gamma/tau